MPLLHPRPVTIKTLDGSEKTYILSKFPAIAGREIVAKYPLTALPKVAEYSQNEEIMLKLMCYVAVEVADGTTIPLTTRALVDNHFPDWETLAKVEIEMMRYNTSFFGKGEISSFLKVISQNLLKQISPTLTPLLQQLSEAIKRRSNNSRKNTP